ncbi:kynureninase [Saitoella complicata NRRL Y-17804]|uniref:kynureninase n=1 Tax=Saitoella complicata (strain BCRC 22490 / CBS 7301 / JCM 7358 / NBRC 10748 / NRRL Y-17804) TaxID=698492 RepID=UPI0008669B3C|nr:kynureninase [Saitoella complicata NRRL Y-17804]ODQ53013.1 kynureninase [Saitoella complicata NRRL Y-17804]
MSISSSSDPLHLANDAALDVLSEHFAAYCDAHDSLSNLRSEFHVPLCKDITTQTPDTPNEECIYFCGNSLGLQPKRTESLLLEELAVWKQRGVQGHFRHPLGREWVAIDETVTTQMATVVGAVPAEVAVMGSLTANLHLLLASFYTPTKERYKIIMESKAFPSDHYAIESQITWNKLSPSSSLILIDPLPGNYHLTTPQILATIDEHADSTALIMLSGLQFYTGQAFDIQLITQHAHSKGILVGWDLAHAAGNLDLKLHDWDVDFAAWCNYKYINAGPGAIASIFIHERHSLSQTPRPRLSGWWGHDKASRFRMENVFKAIPGAAGYQLSNPSVLDVVALLGSLQIFSQTSMTALRAKSQLLTTYLHHLLLTHFPGPSPPFTIITPTSPSERGAQLSLLFKEGTMQRVFERLERAGCVVDERKPDVIRVAPAPLYNTFREVWRFVWLLKKAVEEL